MDRWEDNIMLDVEELESGYMNWIDLFRNRDSITVFTLVNVVMKLRVA